MTAVRGRTWYSGGFDLEREARASEGSSVVGIARLGPRTRAALIAGARLGEAQGSAGTGTRQCRPGTQGTGGALGRGDSEEAMKGMD